MANNNITAANANLNIISTNGVIDVTKFSADGIIDMDQVRLAETRVGVDGQMVAGYVPQGRHAVLHLEAVSNGVEYLMNLAMTCQATKTPAAVVLTLTVPSMEKRFTCTGFLTDVPPAYNLGTTVNALDFGFDFQDVIPTSM